MLRSIPCPRPRLSLVGRWPARRKPSLRRRPLPAGPATAPGPCSSSRSRTRCADAREQRGHRGGALQPRGRAHPDRRQLKGFYDPSSPPRHPDLGDPARQQRLLRRPDVDTDTLDYNFGAAPEPAHRRRPPPRLHQQPRTSTNSRVPDLQPLVQLRLRPVAHPAAAARTSRSTASACRSRSPRRTRRSRTSQFRQTVVNTVAEREAARTTTSSTPSTTWRPSARAWPWPSKLLDENQIKVRVGHHGPARRGGGGVRGGEPRGGGDRGRGRGAGRRGRAEARRSSTTTTPRCWDDAHRARPTGPPRSPSPWTLTAAIRNALEKRTDIVGRAQEPGERGDNVDVREEPEAAQPGPGRAATAPPASAAPVPRPEHRRPAHPRRSRAASASALGDVFGRDFPTWTHRRQRLATRSSTGRPARRAARARIAREQSRGQPAPPGDADHAARCAARPARWRRTSSAWSRRRAARVLQERRLDAETEEVRGRHVHELPGHPEPARPGRRRGGGAARDRRLPQEPRQLRARAGGRHRRRRRLVQSSPRQRPAAPHGQRPSAASSQPAGRLEPRPSRAPPAFGCPKGWPCLP